MTVFVNVHCTVCGERLHQVTLEHCWYWLGPDHPTHTCWWRRSDYAPGEKPWVDTPTIKTKGGVDIKDYLLCYWCGESFVDFEELGKHVWNGCSGGDM